MYEKFEIKINTCNFYYNTIDSDLTKNNLTMLYCPHYDPHLVVSYTYDVKFYEKLFVVIDNDHVVKLVMEILCVNRPVREHKLFIQHHEI